MNYEDAMKNCIFRFCSGSRAYGLNDETSDFDYRGVFIAPLKHAFDVFHTSFVGDGTINDHLKAVAKAIEERNWHVANERIRLAMVTDHADLNLSVGTVKKTNDDEELQELRKFFKLASECNPNLIEFLYSDRLITHETDVWKKIKKHRDLFLSKRARYTFSGYGFAQLRKIKSHRKYLLNPPKHQPTRSEFGLPENTTISKDCYNAILTIPSELLQNSIKEIVINEKKYRDAMIDWNAYKRWEKERNPKRKEMESKFHFDLKHATHLIRLCKMSKEILQDKTVYVFRPDREELLEIKNGKWSFEQVIEYAENIESELDEIYQQSDLRSKPDLKGIAKLYKEICEEYYNIKID